MFITYLGNAQYLDFDYESNPCLPYPLVFENGITAPVSNTTSLNSTAPVAITNATESVNCSVINPNGSLANGNSLFILFDSKSLQAILQVVEPCNKTNTGDDGNAISNETAAVPNSIGKTPNASEIAKQKRHVGELLSPPLKPPVGGTNPTPTNGTINAGNPPSQASGGLLCDVLTLVQNLVDAILKFVLDLLKNLIGTIVNLLEGIIRSLLGNLVPQLLKTVDQLLDTLLTDVLDNVGQIVNGTLGQNRSVPDVVGKLIGPLGANETSNNSSLVDSLSKTINGVIQEVENLLKGLLVQDVLGKEALLSNITAALNNTLEDLLEDVDKLVNDSLTDLLGNSSLVEGLKTDLINTLKDVLGDTVCSVEKLLTDSKSLSELIQNLLKLIQGLLDNVLKDVDKLLGDVLKKLLSDKGLVDHLLDNILKILTDALTNLLAPNLNKLKNSQPIKDPDGFKKSVNDNVTSIISGSNPLPVPASTLPLPPGPSLPVPANIALPLDELLDNLIHTIQDVIEKVEDLLTNKDNGLLSGILKSVEKLLDDLLSNLGKEIPNLLGPQLSNLIDPSSLLGPLGTIITNILKQVVCDSCNKVPPPVTQKPSNDSNCTNLPIENPPCIPFYYPIQPPCQIIEDTLFDNINDPDGFVSGLDQYQDYISRNVYDSIAGELGDGGELLDFLPKSNSKDSPCDFPLDFEALPYRLLRGLEGTTKLTGDVAFNGLWNLVNAVTNTSSSSASATIPLPAPSLLLPSTSVPEQTA